MSNISILDVNLYGRKIGNLTHIQGDRSIFSFDQNYIDDPQRPTLSLSYKDDTGGLLTESKPVQTKVEPFFSNLLPEGPLRRYLADKARIKESREFFLLGILGRDLPGAVTLTPADGDIWPEDEDESDRKYGSRNALRFSLAGVQLKFSAVKNNGKAAGLSIPAKGTGGSWIVKLPADRFEGVPENEFAMMNLARAVGMDIPEISLIDIDSIHGLPDGLGDMKGQKAFVIKRFDRTETGSVHIEDFAQVFALYPEDKYKKATYRRIAHVLRIETDENSMAEFISRLVFSTLIGNADMHVKNWSLIYPDGRRPQLSPAYDLLSTIPYIKDTTAALKYARTKTMTEFGYDELRYLSAQALLPEHPVIRTAKDTVEKFMHVWNKEKSHLDVKRNVISDIEDHLATLQILKD